MGVETQTTTLTEFLLARIAEDEAAVDKHRVETGRKWIAYEDADSLEARVVTFPPDPDLFVIAEVRNLPDAEHIASFHPARVLAECEAKRRIVELHDGSHECSTFDRHGEIDNCTWCPGATDCSTMRLLAAIYADHPDYREEWRP